jgi:alkylhydroperoxidase/carboxymuconolactone decarboxylase family protein YurZ
MNNIVKKNSLHQIRSILPLVAAFFFTVSNLAANKTNMNTKTLSIKDQSIITISAFTANGDINQLKNALNEGLDAGLTINQIKEILIQLYAYTGFPRSLNAINLFMNVLQERKEQGVEDTVGKEATEITEGYDKDAYGAKVRAKLSGLDHIPEPQGFQLFAPEIDTFLKEHLFADIFIRNNIPHSMRELATISALAAMHGTESQLFYHLGGALNTGISEKQLSAFVEVVKKHVGEKKGITAESVLKRVFEKRK